MITLGRSTTSTHILDGSRKALCGFPNAFREVLEMEDLTLFDRSMDGRLCERCKQKLSARGSATPAEVGGNSQSQSESKAQPPAMLSVDVRLGKCQEMSPALHVMPGLDQAFGTPLCNQGHVKYAIGAVPTTLKFPAEGDVSKVSVEEGPVCSKCLKSLQRAAKEDEGKSAGLDKPSEPDSARAPAKDLSMAPQHLKHKLSQLTELKDAFIRGEIRYPAYIRKALPLQKEIQELEAEVR